MDLSLFIGYPLKICFQGFSCVARLMSCIAKSCDFLVGGGFYITYITEMLHILDTLYQINSFCWEILQHSISMTSNRLLPNCSTCETGITQRAQSFDLPCVRHWSLPVEINQGVGYQISKRYRVGMSKHNTTTGMNHLKIRKLKWHIPGEPLVARYNWCQGLVLGRGLAVEKHCCMAHHG